MNSNNGSVGLGSGQGQGQGGPLYDRPPSSFDRQNAGPVPGSGMYNHQHQHQQRQGNVGRERPLSMISTGSSSSAGNLSNAISQSQGEASLRTFEDQVRALPFVQDLLDRVVRCEFSAKEIHRELGDLSRKVNFLLERAEGGGTPATTGGIATTGKLMDAGGGGNMGGGPTEDVRALAQRLESLSTSVQHLVTLQTQAHVHNQNQNPYPNQIGHQQQRPTGGNKGPHPPPINQSNNQGGVNLTNINANGGIGPLTPLGGLGGGLNGNMTAATNVSNNVLPGGGHPHHLGGPGSQAPPQSTAQRPPRHSRDGWSDG